jgi:hypothetical protein
MIGDQMNANAQMPKPLALTDRQLRLIETAARAVHLPFSKGSAH